MLMGRFGVVRKHAQVLAEDKEVAQVCPTYDRKPCPASAMPCQPGQHRRRLVDAALYALAKYEFDRACPNRLQVFEEHCWNDFEADNVTWRLCYSDEHYFATTLAVHGLDEVCNSKLSHVLLPYPHKIRIVVALPLQYQPHSMMHASALHFSSASSSCMEGLHGRLVCCHARSVRREYAPLEAMSGCRPVRCTNLGCFMRAGDGLHGGHDTCGVVQSLQG